MDRKKSFALSRAIDDIVDYANSTVDEMEIYEVSSDDYLRKWWRFDKAAREISDAVKILETYPMLPWNHAVAAKSSENAWRRPYHNALAHLFKKTDTVIC